MHAVAGSDARPDVIHDGLLALSAEHLLGFDLAWQNAVNNPVRHNVGWLSVTHELTFANACRRLGERHPDLWPAMLLQMACFVGRNAAYMLDRLPLEDWHVGDDPAAFIERERRALIDHGQPEFIVSAHLVKVLTAAEDEIATAGDAPWHATLVAGVNRFLHSPLKRRHGLRTANQAIDFVSAGE